MLTRSQRNQYRAVRTIIHLVRVDLGTRPADSVRRALHGQYWFDADIGLDHLLFALYAVKHPDCHSLKDLARRYHYGYDVYSFSDEYVKRLRTDPKHADYIFVNEPEIVSLLAGSWLARSCAGIWLTMFCRNKRQYGVEVPQGCHYDVVQTKKLCYLLHGVIQADGFMHLSPWHGMPKQIMPIAEWKCEWKKDAHIIPADWD